MLCKLFFYLIVAPLSWLPLTSTQALYRKLSDRCWPEDSYEYHAAREAAITLALAKGYILRTDRNQIRAYRSFRDEEVLVADDLDPIVRWKQALRWVQLLK